jgi:hypothetical protein
MRKLPIMGLALAALGVAVGASAWSCSQTPTNVPIRTFEGAQKVAVVCLQIQSTPDRPLAPNTGAMPVAQNNCAPVAAGVAPNTLPYHLVAAVTQTTRGELAIVDLTGGYVVDEDQSTPGTNFIPVGTNPTDVAIPPDGAFTYVSSAAATKPAIYAIDSRRLLGDSLAANTPTTPPLQLTDLAACSLPQPPLALAIASVPSGSEPDGDGVPNGSGADAGGVQAAYALIALLGARGGRQPRVVAIDPANFIQQTQPPGELPPCVITGGVTLGDNLPESWRPGPFWPDGVPYVDGGVDLVGQEPAVGPPGICSPAIVPPVEAGALPDAGGASMGTEDAGAAEEGGIEDAAVADGGIVDAPVEDAPMATGAAPMEPVAPEAGSLVAEADAASPDASFALALAPFSLPNPSSMVMRDDQHLLYVADLSLPMIHVIDLRDPSHPREIEPLLATSVAEPTRPVKVGGLALSPPTSEYKRYLYAIDQALGGIIVYDVTDAAASPHVPLLRPHPELDPFAPIDRLTFAAPVAAVAFAQHDWPLQVPAGFNVTPNVSLAYQGLFCNPNRNAHPNATTFKDLGAFYRVDQAGVIQPNGTAANFPMRLRGVFAFATLSNGTVMTIDVDDWDAPCRRPDPMAPLNDAGQMTGSLDVPQPDADGGLDFDPYHTPLAYQGGSLSGSSPVTVEAYFPVSAPHRIRSSVLVRNDPTTGDHVPSFTTPQLTDLNGAPVPTSGRAGVANPLLLPTELQAGFIDPTQYQSPSNPNPNMRMPLPEAGTFPDPAASPPPGVRLSFEDPTVAQNQDWTVTYEGTLPATNGILANITSSPPGDYKTLDFTVAGANLCQLGIEDWSIGKAEAAQAQAALKANGLQVPKNVPRYPDWSALQEWTTDYVEITSDILPSNDPYWNLPQACWDIPGTDLADGGNMPKMSTASQRYNLCQATFGAPGSNPDQNVTRDAPILEAYTDHLKVGRFGGFPNDLETTMNRLVDPGLGNSNNPIFLKLITCCFNKQATFKVRAGGEWIAVGQQGVGLLNHVKADSNNRCVLSCDPQDSLLNARSFDVPWAQSPCTTGGDGGIPSTPPSIERNDPLAMRNPMFSYVTWSGCGSPMSSGARDHTLTARDLTWKFSVTNGFSPLTISLSGANGISVSPQSMLFISSLGQLAVVDGAQQGLVLIDLNTVGFSTNYF